jgi:hypothetical protein
MDDIFASLSSRTGIDVETVKKGLGVVLTYLQKSLPPDHFDTLQTALPGSRELVSAYEAEPGGAGSGLLGMVSGLAGKLFGGQTGDGSHLLSDLSRVGLSAEQIEAYLPQAFELLKAYLPPELLELVKAALPTLATPSKTGGA